MMYKKIFTIQLSHTLAKKKIDKQILNSNISASSRARCLKFNMQIKMSELLSTSPRRHSPPPLPREHLAYLAPEVFTYI